MLYIDQPIIETWMVHDDKRASVLTLQTTTTIWSSIETFVYYMSDRGCDKTIEAFLLPRPRRGLRGIVFTRSVCLSVCVCVCLCICVSGQYFGILFLGY